LSRLDLPCIYPIVDLHDASAAERTRVGWLARTLADAGATIIQLRAKPLGAGDLSRLAAELVAPLAASRCRLIVNDRADVALVAGAAGVHLGDQDLPVVAARAVIGARGIIGYSTHDEADLARADAMEADYLGFGPIFESPTKPGARDPRGIEALERVSAHAGDTPVVAIGGVTLEQAPALWAAGAASVALISEIERAPDPARLLRSYFDAAPR
jgi:thiamine-phosphate pyrophosphorylase